jgi:hypothetical protein
MPNEHPIKITEKQRVLIAQMIRDGTDPISFFCSVLRDESAPVEARKEAARELKPYYHPRLAMMGPYLKRFAD